MQKIRKESQAAAEAEGKEFPQHGSFAVIDYLVEQGRPARGRQQASTSTTRTASACGCGRVCGRSSTPEAASSRSRTSKERMLFAEAVETARCIEEGVITSVPDANIGSIFGIGFPAWTGGVVQYMNQYEGGLGRLRRTLPRTGQEVRRTVRTHAASLVEKANKGEVL